MRKATRPFATIALAALCAASCVIAQSAVDRIDPMIGAAPSRGSCIVGPAVPNGSIHPSPDTLGPSNAGFVPGEPVVGFSQLHAQGAGGVPSYGNLLIMPQIGLKTVERDYASPMDEVVARADSFACRLVKSDVRVKLAPQAHSAIYAFTFPQGSDATITLDVARKITKNENGIALRGGSLAIDSASGQITGSGTYVGSWTGIPYELFYAIEVDRAPTNVGTWVDQTVSPDSTSARGGGKPMGAFLRFDARENREVKLKIAVSFKSIEQAQHWLNEEINGWDLDAVVANARDAWEKELSRVTLEGATDAQSTAIYSALRHTMIQPRERTNDHPGHRADEPYFDEQYTLWDTWKTQYPLMHLLRPSESARVIDSFIARQRVNGRVNTALLHGKEANMYQGGDEVDNVIADAFVKRLPGVDWNAAYDVVHANATKFRTPDYLTLGYTSMEEETGRRRSASATLAYAYNDFCAALVAEGIGREDDAKTFRARGRNWLNVWDPAMTDEGFAGFARSRKRDGSWSTSTAQDGHDFYQGTAWNYSFCVPGDLPLLMEKMGGRAKFIERLEHAFEKNRTDYANEPGFQLTWWFAGAGRPDLTSKWVDHLLSKYSNAEGYPGDDDSGAMSSLYFFATAGLFPVAGQDLYYLHGGRVPALTLHLENGKTFTIRSKNTSSENLYVQSATLNGQPINEPVLRHGQIVAGGELVFEMGPQPSAWGRAE